MSFFILIGHSNHYAFNPKTSLENEFYIMVIFFYRFDYLLPTQSDNRLLQICEEFRVYIRCSGSLSCKIVVEDFSGTTFIYVWVRALYLIVPLYLFTACLLLFNISLLDNSERQTINRNFVRASPRRMLLYRVFHCKKAVKHDVLKTLLWSTLWKTYAQYEFSTSKLTNKFNDIFVMNCNLHENVLV